MSNQPKMNPFLLSDAKKMGQKIPAAKNYRDRTGTTKAIQAPNIVSAEGAYLHYLLRYTNGKCMHWVSA